MFGLKSKQQMSPQGKLRDALFGDARLDQVINVSPQALSSQPWASFKRAKDFLDRDDSKLAIEALQDVLAMPQMEPRIILQAWHLLRELGVKPPQDQAKQVLGVVAEVGMPKGTDLVAGYADHCARYWNFSGAGVVWERPNDSLDGLIDDLLNKGTAAILRLGPWKETRPPAPPNGVARINFLTPSGLHFGQGPMNILAKDAIGGPALASAYQLMKALMELGKIAQAAK